jgi:hypothetical protein
MGLVDDLQAPAPLITRCGLSAIREQLQDDEREALDVALSKIRSDQRQSRAKRYSCEWLANTLTDNGYPISRSTVSRHLNGECSCE